MGYNDRHESGGGSNAVLVVAIVLALLLGVPLVLGIILVFVGGIFFVRTQTEFDTPIPMPVVASDAGPTSPGQVGPSEAQANLPSNRESGSGDAPQALDIAIEANGQTRVDAVGVMNDDELRQWIKDRLGDNPKDASAIVRAHPDAEFTDVVRVMTVLGEMGVRKISFRDLDETGDGPESDEPSESPARNSSEP
jgi:biopolymer transport protein ExbD